MFEAPDPESCAAMTEVRAGVDEVDRMLVKLMARRQRYMDAAARIKPSRAVVRDLTRVEQVVARVREAAARDGLSLAIAEPVWRTLIERCIAYEFGVFDSAAEAKARAGAEGA